MKFWQSFALTVCSMAFFSNWAAAGQTTSTVPKILAEIASALEKVSGFEAEVESRHETAEDDVVVTRTLLLSRQFGWRISEGTGKLRREILNDLSTNVVFYPEQKRALKLVARSPEVKSEFEKPVRELNPVFALDRSSVKFHGVEEFEGETVYHLSGTTTTQFLQMGKPVKIKVEAWIAQNDGLPRKTVERWEDRTGTTIYKNVKLRDDLTSEAFRFTPPNGVQIIELGSEGKELSSSTSPETMR